MTLAMTVLGRPGKQRRVFHAAAKRAGVGAPSAWSAAPPPAWRYNWGFGWALLVVSVACFGCSEPGNPAGGSPNTVQADEPEAAERLVLRPGDSLLDSLGSARLVQHPETVLPPAVAELAQGALVDWFAPLPPDVWKATPEHHVPTDVQPLMDADPGLTLWYTVPPLSAPADGEELNAYLFQGVPVPTWDGSAQGLRTAPVLWYPRRHGLLALAHAPPEGVESRLRIASSVEFGGMERGRLLLGREPQPADMLERFELGDVDRPALLLASGAALEWSVDSWEADGIEIALGLMDQGWIEVEGSLLRTTSRSDGVTLAVELDGRRVWERTLPPEAAGTMWQEEVLQIPVPRGEGFTLRLLTEGGPAGEATGDYAVWGSLRAVGRPTRAPGRPHVVLIDIDTLRADRLAAYRSPATAKPEARVTTPGIDAWASAHAMVYTDSVSTASWTLPATVSMLTGLAVHQHGVDAHEEALGPGVATLASRLGDAGYETWAMVTGAFLDTRYGCSLGFDRYESREPRHMDWEPAIGRLLANDSERPLFIFLQTYAVHQPYPHDELFADPEFSGFLAGQEVNRRSVFLPVEQGKLDLSDDELAHVEAMYDALVVRMDQAVARFLVQLGESVDPEHLLIVFTSDHGEGFLEHGLLSHGKTLHGEMLRVPLVVQYPDGTKGLDARPVSGLDVVPTVLDVVGLSPESGLPGRSLRAEPEADTVRMAELDGRHQALNSGGYKLMQSDGGRTDVRLFRLGEDPQEHRNRAADLPEIVDDLRRRLDWFQATYPPSAEGSARTISPGAEQIEQLRALGYLGDG